MEIHVISTPIWSLKVAFGFSDSIEILQLLLRLGTFQLSDIFYNVLGGLAGALLYIIINRIKIKRKKRNNNGNKTTTTIY